MWEIIVAVMKPFSKIFISLKMSHAVVKELGKVPGATSGP